MTPTMKMRQGMKKSMEQGKQTDMKIEKFTDGMRQKVSNVFNPKPVVMTPQKIRSIRMSPKGQLPKFLQ